MTIQIFHYEFLGPIKLSEWGPPMEEVLYLLLSYNSKTYNFLYAGETGKTDDKDFFIKNEKFKCWISYAGSQENLYLSIFPMWGSQPEERIKIVNRIVARYKPACNVEDQSFEKEFLFK
ncbi:MAG: hypothetical protein ACREA3_06370 [Nitrosotalea sp.]